MRPIKSALSLALYTQTLQFVLDTPEHHGKSSGGWLLTSSTGVSPQLWFSQSRPHCVIPRARGCDWTGVRNNFV